MELAVMQPYFFPYIGYFQLIDAADRFVLADEVQYIRHGWINRNRIHNVKGECCYITAPVKKHCSQSIIKNVSVVEGEKWKEEILKQLEVYRKKAPFYKDVYLFLEHCLAFKSTSIAALNQFCINQTCRYIGIEKEIELQSDLKLDYTEVKNKTDRVFQFCFQLGADTYINLPGGVALYDRDVFSKKDIELKFIKPNLRPYQQLTSQFDPALSILDMMMFNTPEEIKEMVKDYQLI